ncbi:MAG TPA: hypothetical protein VIM84_00065, partial [Gemmatimonadales bacterium]
AAATVGLGGVFCVAGGVLLFALLPGLRGEARQLILAQQPAALPQSPAGTETGPPLTSPSSS